MHVFWHMDFAICETDTNIDLLKGNAHMANYFEEDEEPVKKKAKNSYEKKLARLKELREKHKGDWLNLEACKEYHNRALALPPNGQQDIGERRKLRIELQEKYGIAEIEAINIVNGFHFLEYVLKYENIKNLRIPSEPSLADRQYITIVQNEGYAFEEND